MIIANEATVDQRLRPPLLHGTDDQRRACAFYCIHFTTRGRGFPELRRLLADQDAVTVPSILEYSAHTITIAIVVPLSRFAQWVGSTPDWVGRWVADHPRFNQRRMLLRAVSTRFGSARCRFEHLSRSTVSDVPSAALVMESLA